MSEQTLDIRKLMTGKDGQLFITGSDRSQIFLAEVDQFEARINFSNADYQPISSYLSISVPTSYTVTLTFSEAVIRDDVVLKPIYDALASGISQSSNSAAVSARHRGATTVRYSANASRTALWT